MAMTVPAPAPGSSTTPPHGTAEARIMRIAIWVAIGALIVAAIVCVVWVLLGSQDDVIGRAFLTILLLAAFAGVSILDARLAPGRPGWFVLLSMSVWVLILLIGAFLIWMPERGYPFDDWGSGLGRFISFLVIVLVLQLGVLHVRLYTKSWLGRGSTFTTAVGWVTTLLVAILALMLVFPLMVHEWIAFHDIYWRLVVAIAILAAVGTALVPLVNALFAPKRPRAPRAVVPAQPALLPWPTFVDGVTPLPALPDGSPDWNAYYTGHPTYPAMPQGAAPFGGDPSAPAPQGAPAQIAPAAPASAPQAPAPQAAPEPYAPPATAPDGYPGAAPQQPAYPPVAPPPGGYQGYPPPPPLPPRG
jgi:hypothetical protein